MSSRLRIKTLGPLPALTLLLPFDPSTVTNARLCNKILTALKARADASGESIHASADELALSVAGFQVEEATVLRDEDVVE